jgi:hypothetical protein
MDWQEEARAFLPLLNFAPWTAKQAHHTLRRTMDAARYVITLRAGSAEDDALLSALRRLPSFRHDFEITKLDIAVTQEADNPLPAFHDRVTRLEAHGPVACDAIRAVLSDAPDASLQAMARAQQAAADRVWEDKEAHFLSALYAQTEPGPSYALVLRRPPWPVDDMLREAWNTLPAHMRRHIALRPYDAHLFPAAPNRLEVTRPGMPAPPGHMLPAPLMHWLARH